MKRFFKTELKMLIKALEETGYHRDRMRPRSLRKDSYHVLLIATQGGVILELHKDTTIKVDERHIRHHGKYTGKDQEGNGSNKGVVIIGIFYLDSIESSYFPPQLDSYTSFSSATRL